MMTRPALAVLSLLCLLSSAAHAADKVSLQLGWIPSGERAQYYLAKEAGYFAAENLDVQIIPGKGGTYSLTKVLTGAADFGESGFVTLLTARIAEDLPVAAIMPQHTAPLDALITTEGSGIRSLADLTGKTVGTSPFTSSNSHWPFLLKMNRIDPASITLVNADVAALVPMLASGKLDAAILYASTEPVVNAVLHTVGKTARILPWADYGLAGYGNVVFASKQTLATKREMAVRFVRALKKGLEAMRADPAKAAAAVKAEVPESDALLIEQTIRASAPGFFNANTDRDGLGVFSPRLVQTTWEWAAREENVPVSKIDPLSVVDITVAR